ncbi:MAG: G5 domain-containing protein [Anaerolineae bacterium]|nr:G5 domain-containing protein [Anaerolineae bacterium]
MHLLRHWLLLVCTAALLLTACTTENEEPSILVTLIADGRELTLEYQAPVTVGEVLRDWDIVKGELDRVEPPEFTQISNGMRITVVRVVEERECEEEVIAHKQRIVQNEGLQAGERVLSQAGQNGVEEVCYRVSIEDGVRRDRVEVSRVELVAPQDEVIFVGATGELDPVPITGTLAYIGNNNAWVMRGSSTTKRALTSASDLDQRVFSLSADGRQLLFTRRPVDNTRENFLNELWFINDTTSDNEPLQLVPEDVLSAQWVPGKTNTISYSTGEARPVTPGWRAFNDLWIMQLDPSSGSTLDIEEFLEPSTGGLYGWWGTTYEWSPQGDALAWVQADSIGLVNLENGDLESILNFPLFNPRADWSWRATISWSDDASLLLTTVHGAPVGNEPAEFSPVFNVAVTDQEGNFTVDIFDNAGIWAAPQFSPLFDVPGTEFKAGYIAYLQARDIANSINSQAEYDLMVADRDGSNARSVFPPEGQPGLNAPQDLAWSPDARQVAFIYQGNLWIIDVESEVAHQLTLDGGASKPIWTR